MNTEYRDTVVATLKALLPAVREKYQFEEVIKFLEDFEQIGPYKVGDRVVLVDPPSCDGGWGDSKHFLIPGALATVRSVEWWQPSDPGMGSRWCLGLAFDNESWIPRYDTVDGHKAGVPIPTPFKERHCYIMAASRVRPLDSEASPDNLEAGQL